MIIILKKKFFLCFMLKKLRKKKKSFQFFTDNFVFVYESLHRDSSYVSPLVIGHESTYSTVHSYIQYKYINKYI